MISASISEVPMAPDGRITWQRTEVADGVLYLPGQDTDTDAEMAELLLSDVEGEPLGEPDPSRRVFVPPEHEDIVLKEFISSGLRLSVMGGLPSLRANVLLAAGLDMLEQRGAWRIRGNTVLGALVLNDAENNVLARWAMVRALPVPGVPTTDYMSYEMRDPSGLHRGIVEAPKKPRLPHPNAREKLYTEAIEVASGMSFWRDFIAKHDDHADNVVLERLPQLGRNRPIIGPKVIEQGLATKLDIIGSQGFNF